MFREGYGSMGKREGGENFVHESLERESSNNNEKVLAQLTYILLA